MKKLTLLFISLFVSLISFAGEVTEEQALQKAQQFMQGKQFKQKNLRRAAAIGGKSFYVFNAEQNGGFVIVSADDRTEPILGYADQGNIDINKLPENTKKWLEGYEQQINALRLSSLPKASSHRAIGGAIAPLLSCHWAQESPFNGMCPLDGEIRCVTGCVATAMAQIMYYYKWPETAVGPLAAYTTYSQKISVPELPATTFKWDKMKDTYKYGEEGEASDAVAELMRYCGQAVTMDYTAFVSGSALKASSMKCFGYSQTAREVDRNNYTTKDWEEILYHELSEKRPVPYGGFTSGAGHQFIIDGYDENGLFHVNWGWGGMDDGYYVLSVLNPYNDYSDYSMVGANGWCMGQYAIIGLQPDNGKDDISPRVYSLTTFTTPSYTRTGTEDFTIDVDGSFGSWAGKDLTIDYRWVISKDGSIVKEFDPQLNVLVKNNDGYSKTDRLSFGTSFEDGNYELRQMYRFNSSEAWKYCDYYTDPNVIIMSINGIDLTLKNALDLTNTYQINSVEIQGPRKTCRGMTAVINWTNKGYLHETPFYLWDNRSWFIGSVSSYVNHNETDEIKINFPGPETPGDVVYKITTDEAGTNVLWTSEPLTFEESLPQNLTGQIDIANSEIVNDPKKPGWVLTMVKGTTIDATITLKNEGEHAYDDIVCIGLRTIDDDALVKYGERKEETFLKEISLGVGEETTLTAQFTNLVKGVRYSVDADYVYVYPNQVGLVSAANLACEVGGGDYIPGDVNGDGLVNVTDIVATVNFIMEKPSDGFNKDAADLNGDGLVNVTDIVKMVSIIMNGNG